MTSPQERHAHKEHTLDQAAERIAEAPAPVLFPDTCALVDLVRMPNPDRTPRKKVEGLKRNLRAADALRSKAEARPRALWVVLPPPIPEEYDKNAPRAAEDVRRSWEKIDDRVCVSRFAADVLDDVQGDVPPQSRFSQRLTPLLASVKTVADDLIGESVRLQRDEDCFSRASLRAMNKDAPGHRGGEIQDCVIAEHTLALSEMLKERGVKAPRVLLTSNTRDFCTARDSSDPKPPLDRQLNGAGLELAIKWEQANALLKSTPREESA